MEGTHSRQRNKNYGGTKANVNFRTSHTISKIKNSLDSLTNRMEETEDRVRKWRLTEMTNPKKRKKDRTKSKRPSEMHKTRPKVLTLESTKYLKER